MGWKLKYFAVFIFAVFLVFPTSISAFEVGNLSHSIEKSYAPGEYIKGWLNFSLDNHPTSPDASLRVFFDNSTPAEHSINLMDLLELNGAVYTCNPSDCGTTYAASAGAAQKNFELNKESPFIFGFKILGDFEDISRFSLNVQSSALAYPKPQLYIDILDDGVNEWQVYRSSGAFGQKNYGCYESSSSGNVAFITQAKYCGKINISEAPNVKIGANVVKESGSGAVAFELSIYNENYDGFCEANASSTGEVSCVPDDFKVSKKQDFFACISTLNSEDDGKYSIKYEENNPCGFSGQSSNKFDFDIFAQQGIYALVGNFTLNNDELANSGIFDDEIEPYIKNYIQERFSNNCTGGCVIPIKLTSGKDSNSVTISNLDVSYTAGISKVTRDIYSVLSQFPTISSSFQKLNLDSAEFSAPTGFGEHEFSLYLGSIKLFSEQITVEKVPSIISLTPRTTSASMLTKFKVNAVSNSGANISQYVWDFGDGKPQTTTKNTIDYTFDSIGKFNVSVTVEDKNGFSSSKTFSIVVKSSVDAVNKSLSEKLELLKKINKQINDFPLFYQDSIKSVLDLDNMESEITEIQKLYDRASGNESESYYTTLMQRLAVLDIPKSIKTSKSADSVSFYPKRENINLEILKEIAGGDYSASDEEKYIDAILAWNQENAKTKITFGELSADYDDFSKVILNVLKIDAKNPSGDNVYFVIRKMQDLKFKDDSSERNESGYIYIPITTSEKTIEFSTAEDVSIFNLPLFISPEINKLQIAKAVSFEEGKKLSKWIIFALVFFIFISLAFIVYIIMQRWYRLKYENYLFKNRNDLYNLISYIENAKKKGIDESEIRKRLKKTGWSSEQVNYIVKKYLGKRTGMVEISIDKILNFFRKNDSRQTNYSH